jgi:hypothetical protein
MGMLSGRFRRPFRHGLRQSRDRNGNVRAGSTVSPLIVVRKFRRAGLRPGCSKAISARPTRVGKRKIGPDSSPGRRKLCIFYTRRDPQS